MRIDQSTPKAPQWEFSRWFGRTRRLTIIPSLFFVLIVAVVGFSLHSVNVNKQLNDLVRVITWQRKIKEHYILNLYNRENGIQANTQTPINDFIRNLRTMRDGGTIQVPGVPRPIYLQAASHPAIREELQRKIRLYEALRQKGDALINLKQGTPAYRTCLLEFNLLLKQIELPSKEILKIYMDSVNKQLNGILLMEILTILLASVVGLLLSILQKRSDKALEESEHRFRQIFDAGPLGNVLIDLNGKAIRVNTSLGQILGYPTQELMRQTMDTVTHPVDLEQERPLRVALFNGEIQSYQVEKRYRHQDGHDVWALTSTALINDNRGKPSFAVVQIKDISEQKNTMEALLKSENRYRNVIESATDGIIVANMDNIIISANTHAHHIFEYEPGELIGQTLPAIIPPMYRDAHLRGIAQVQATHQPSLNGKLLELEGLKKNSALFPVELSLSAWENADGEMLATAILRDITERKCMQREREALLQTNKNLEEFTLIASHDLQEPLRKIVFYTERFINREDFSLKEESLKDIQRLLSSVYRMQNLITDLLAYSRISPQFTHFTQVNLSQVLQWLEFEMSGEIQHCGGQLEIEPLPVIEADESQIQILFRHLVQNALKYRRLEVSPLIRIYGKLLESHAGSYETPWLEIRIQDNGIGFNEKYLDRIFKVFQKLHSQTEFSGTGIGLATCKKIVEQHSGSITASSEPGQGTTFIITLPIRQKD